jgi:hypothetical protein
VKSNRRRGKPCIGTGRRRRSGSKGKPGAKNRQAMAAEPGTDAPLEGHGNAAGQPEKAPAEPSNTTKGSELSPEVWWKTLVNALPGIIKAVATLVDAFKAK